MIGARAVLHEDTDEVVYFDEGTFDDLDAEGEPEEQEDTAAIVARAARAMPGAPILDPTRDSGPADGSDTQGPVQGTKDSGD